MKIKLITGVMLIVCLRTTLDSAQADFTHAEFNESSVASIDICQPDFSDVEGGGAMAVSQGILVNDQATIARLHELAQTEHCKVPHVEGLGEQLAVVAYFDAEGKPLALVQLWKSGVYYIYEGFKDEQGNVYQGRAQGDHGGCSCGQSEELAAAITSLLEAQTAPTSTSPNPAPAVE